MMGNNAKNPRSNSPMLSENKENDGASKTVPNNRYSPHSNYSNKSNVAVAGSSAAKRKSGVSTTPATRQRRSATPPCTSHRKPLKDLSTPTPKNGAAATRGSAEKAPGSNPPGGPKRRSDASRVGTGFVGSRERAATIRTTASLEIPKGSFAFLRSTRSVRKCSPTPSLGRTGGERNRSPDVNPNEKNKNGGDLPRSNSNGSRRMRGGDGTCSRDRTPRNSSELKSSSAGRSCQNSGELSVKGSKERSSCSTSGSGECRLKGYSSCGQKEKEKNKPSSCSSLVERKTDRSGSGRIPSQNGMKKNCGLDGGALGKNFNRSFGLGKGVVEQKQRQRWNLDDVDKISDEISNRSGGNQERGGAKEKGVGLTTGGSTRERSAEASGDGCGLHRVKAAPLQKVYLNYCYVTPVHRSTDKDSDFTTTASRLKGRYGEFIPIHALVGGKDGVFKGKGGGECTPSPNTVGRGGDFTPAPNTFCKGGDFTPASDTNGNGGEFTPAQNTMHATPEQRTRVTPPVQPSISPEIHSQNLEELEEGHRCFGAGHVMAPVIGKVRDRRKCRPRGILTVGEATPIPLDENRRFSLVPVPAVASVKWVSSGDAKKLTSPVITEGTPSSGFTQGSPSVGSQNPSYRATPSPGFACGTPSSGFTQGSPSVGSQNPSSRATPSPGFACGTPSSGFSAQNLSPQSTPLSGTSEGSSPGSCSTWSVQADSPYGLTQVISPTGFSSSPNPQAHTLFGFSHAAPCSKLTSKISNQHSTTFGFTPERQNLSTIPPSEFAQEVPYIRGVSSSGLTTGSRNLEGTPSSGISSKFQNLISTPSSTASEFQNNLHTPPSGLTPENLNVQSTFPLENKQEIPNIRVTSSPGSTPQALSWYQSNLDVSSQIRFSPHISPQCGDSQVTTSSVSSQFGFYSDTFPQDGDSQGASLSLKDLLIPSQCADSSNAVGSPKLKTFPVEKHISRQEMQMSIPSSKDFTGIRISWREGLVSRIFKLSELNFCDSILEGSGKRMEDENEYISRKNHPLNTEDNSKVEYSYPFSNKLQVNAPFGSFEYMTEANVDKSHPSRQLASSSHPENALSESLVRSCISLASQEVEAESIDAEDVTTSGDLDWNFCYKNQLFEEAT